MSGSSDRRRVLPARLGRSRPYRGPRRQRDRPPSGKDAAAPLGIAMPIELCTHGRSLSRNGLLLALRAPRHLHHQLGERQAPEGILARQLAHRDLAGDVVAE